MLIGSWVLPHKEYTAVRKGCNFVFKRDGTFSSDGTFIVRDRELRIKVQGKWSVREGVLIEELTNSSHPQLVPVGLLTRDRLLAVQTKNIVFA